MKNVSSNMQNTSTRIILIGTLISKRDAVPNAMAVFLPPLSFFVSVTRTLHTHWYTRVYFANWECQISNGITGGPTKIDCRNGRCTNYTTGTLDCGNEIEEASKSFGSYQTLPDGSNTVHSLYGYEGINKVEPIAIPKNCILSCSGCSRHIKARKKNFRSNSKWQNQY